MVNLKKRKLRDVSEDEFVYSSSSVRRRIHREDHTSTLSNELLIRIFQHLPVETLLICEAVSRRFSSLANDNQVWKSAYIRRFIEPRQERSRRILHGASKAPQRYSNPSPQSLSVELFSKSRTATWKRRYRTRYNWSKGICGIKEISVAKQKTHVPILAALHGELVYIADAQSGLRVYSYRDPVSLLDSIQFGVDDGNTTASPTSLSVNVVEPAQNHRRLTVSFEDGSFRLYDFNILSKKLSCVYRHPAKSRGSISLITISFPYVLTITATQQLELFKFDKVDCKASHVAEPVLLASMRAKLTSAPRSLSLRQRQHEVVAAVAFPTPVFSTGWTVSVQEMIFGMRGELIESRTATAFASEVGVTDTAKRLHQPTPYSLDLNTSEPTCIAYTHPFIIMAHSDNTLTLFTVISTPTALCISPGHRLWGHTSHVSGVHIGGRGKAVSVSARGEEVRIWELEDALTRSDRGSATGASVQVSPMRRRRTGLALAADPAALNEEPTVTGGWVGFDEESVVMVREKPPTGGPALTVYDFT